MRETKDQLRQQLAQLQEQNQELRQQLEIKQQQIAELREFLKPAKLKEFFEDSDYRYLFKGGI